MDIKKRHKSKMKIVVGISTCSFESRMRFFYWQREPGFREHIQLEEKSFPTLQSTSSLGEGRKRIGKNYQYPFFFPNVNSCAQFWIQFNNHKGFFMCITLQQ